MNNKEAIKAIIALNHLLTGGSIDDDVTCGDIVEATKMSVNALEKQIPVKVKISVDDYGTCPACGNVMWFDGSYRYCKECGQALDWRD